MQRAPSQVTTPLESGSRVGRYEVVRQLARGGMSEIYLVKNAGLHNFESLAVLKRLPPHCLVSEPNLVNMFMDEAQLTASLRHPNIPQVFDFGEDDESYFFVMEYVEGSSLSQIQSKCRRNGRPMPVALAVQIIMEVAEALSAAHEAKDASGRCLELVHRDVSPQNVIVTSHGSVKLIDFGIASARQRRERTQTGVIKGKLAYMSPEQCLAEEVDRKSDLFSLGLLLYELTTGTKPQGSSHGPEMLFARVENDCPDPRELVDDYPAELAEIVNRLLRRSRSERFASAREVHEALGRFAIHSGFSLSPFALEAWVEGLERPLARGSGMWTENGSDARKYTAEERRSLARTRDQTANTALMRNPVPGGSRALLGTQYDFEVLEEYEAEPEERDATPADDEPAQEAKRQTKRFMSTGIFWRYVLLFALLGFLLVFASFGGIDKLIVALADGGSLVVAD